MNDESCLYVATCDFDLELIHPVFIYFKIEYHAYPKQKKLRSF